MAKSRVKLALLLAAFTALISAAVLTASPAAAGKSGGNRTAASITLDQTDPHLGDWVTFSTSGGNTIIVNCFQGGLGNMVYGARQDTGTSFLLGLGTSDWQSGPASCVAYLYSRSKFLASTGFEAGDAR